MPTPTLVTVLVDPYSHAQGLGRSHWVLSGELVDRAALAECRDTPSRCRGARWQFGRWTPCADHLADAIAAARRVGVL